MLIGIAKINTAAAAFPFRLAFDRDATTPQSRAPRVVVGRRDRKRYVQLAAAVVWRNHAARRHWLRRQRATALKQEQHAIRAGVECLEPLTVTLHRYKSEDFAIKCRRLLEMIGVENRLDDSID